MANIQVHDSNKSAAKIIINASHSQFIRIFEAMAKCDAKQEAESQLFKFVRGYMNMAMIIYTFFRASKNGD